MQQQILDKIITEINDVPDEKVSSLIDFIHFLKWDNEEPEYTAEWDIEIEKRVNEITQGRIKGIPDSRMFDKITAKYS